MMGQTLIDVLKDKNVDYSLYEQMLLLVLCISLKGDGHANLNYSELHRAAKMHRETVKKTLDDLMAKGVVVHDAKLGYVVTDTRFCESPEKWVQAALRRQAQAAQRGIKGVNNNNNNNNNNNFLNNIYNINKAAGAREGGAVHGRTSGVHGTTGQEAGAVQASDPLDAVYTEDQEKFLKAYRKRPKNPDAFRRFFAESLKDVDGSLDMLVKTAQMHVKKITDDNGDTKFLVRPESWLADSGWRDYSQAIYEQISSQREFERRIRMDAFYKKLRAKEARGEEITEEDLVGGDFLL